MIREIQFQKLAQLPQKTFLSTTSERFEEVFEERSDDSYERNLDEYKPRPEAEATSALEGINC